MGHPRFKGNFKAEAVKQITEREPHAEPFRGKTNVTHVSGSYRNLWRRGGDSNPRYACAYAAFRVRCDRPLCHLSVLVDGCRSLAA